jgi:mercuric ion binding protein
LFFFTILATVLVACQSGEKAEAEEVQNIEATLETAEVVPNQIATIEVDGMTCVMGCGGTIRTSLMETNAISAVEFDFEMGREVNTATITFDKNQISLNEMVELLAKINDGQFTTGETKLSNLPETHVEESNNSTSSSEALIEASTSRFEMPNLLDIFSGLFQ